MSGNPAGGSVAYAEFAGTDEVLSDVSLAPAEALSPVSGTAHLEVRLGMHHVLELNVRAS